MKSSTKIEKSKSFFFLYGPKVKALTSTKHLFPLLKMPTLNNKHVSNIHKSNNLFQKKFLKE